MAQNIDDSLFAFWLFPGLFNSIVRNNEKFRKMAEQFARENEEINKDQCTYFFTKFAQAHFSENEMIEIREILEEKLAKKE